MRCVKYISYDVRPVKLTHTYCMPCDGDVGSSVMCPLGALSVSQSSLDSLRLHQ